MLELKNICKSYHAGDMVQKALDHVSLSFRDCEFAAILGPSGSGKTTLLNIIGGLDRYDEGDLVINGISTKKYKDRDFDAYRNHEIGFIFQSYNLIAHQTILANVELALTISGISGKERRERAVKALEEVGLGDHLNKRPSELSGGQMQRVAIARALVNDPKIVLADEPTGALDTKTSIQVMDLLKKVAKDRLVIMVTHNPELARQYATRIITIRDGRVEGDTNPFHVREEEQIKNASFPRTAMNFLTALSLSFNNLRTKKGRTFLVSFAGSIGIIGIALLLAIEQGLTGFIAEQESEALSSYPLEIYSTGVDVSSLVDQGTEAMTNARKEEQENMTLSSFMGNEEETEEQQVKTIQVNRVAQEFLSRVNENDLSSLKTYLESGESGIGDYAEDIEYSYGITPQIYQIGDDGTASRVNPNEALQEMLSETLDLASLLDSSLEESAFHPLPSDSALYEDDYTLEAGRWPENDHEMVMVLSSDGTVSDLVLYELGIWDTSRLVSMVESFTAGDSSLMDLARQVTGTTEEVTEEETTEEEQESFTCDDFLSLSYKLVNSCDLYTYDESLGLWEDRSDDSSFVNDLASQGEDLSVVGVVMPKDDGGLLTPGLYYPRQLVYDLMEEAAQSAPVKAQLADPDTDIFTGRSFEEEGDTAYDFGSFFTLDEDEVAKAFVINTDAIDEDTAAAIAGPVIESTVAAMEDTASEELKKKLLSFDLSTYLPDDLAAQAGTLTSEDIEELISGLQWKNGTDTWQSLVDGFAAYERSQGTDTGSLYQAVESAISGYLSSDRAASVTESALQDAVSGIATDSVQSLSKEELQQILSEEMEAYLAWAKTASPDGDPSDPTLIAMYFASDEGQLRLSDLVQRFLPGTDTLDETDLQDVVKALIADGQAYLTEQGIPSIDPAALQSDFETYLASAEGKQVLTDVLTGSIDMDTLKEAATALAKEKLSAASAKLQDTYAASLQSAVETALGDMQEDLVKSGKEAASSAIAEAYTTAAEYINEHMSDFFTVDQEQFRASIHIDLTKDRMQALLSSMLGGGSSSLSGNLETLGYADEAEPESISIYAKSFADKGKITDVLDAYNEDMVEAGEPDKVITYTDLVATLMESITDIITAISEILIGFVAISLVVSSIMIGVITYISVLERRKEIGTLRALGASRHNIREVFNAETFITGLLSGLMGVGITEVFLPLVDYIIWSHSGQLIRASLPLAYALGLILLSIVLTVIAGLIPSAQAAASDPVKALRTE